MIDFAASNSAFSDVAIIASFGIAFQLTETLCRKTMFPMIVSKILKSKNKHSVANISKNVWKFLWHSFCLILEFMIFSKSDCLPSVINPYNKEHGTTLLWANTSQPPPNNIRFLYLFQSGYYFVNLIYILFIETPNDLWIMISHHMATLALIAVSYLPVDPSGSYAESSVNAWKYGAYIMLIHEIGDVTLAVVKALNYAKICKKLNELLFVIHILAWIWIRIVWLFRVNLSLLIDIEPAVLEKYRWKQITGFILLSLLLILNIFWTYHMLRLLVKNVKSAKVIADTRDVKKESFNLKKMSTNFVDNFVDIMSWPCFMSMMICAAYFIFS